MTITDQTTTTPVIRTAVLELVDQADRVARQLPATFITYGTIARVSDDGRLVYNETWAAGSLRYEPGRRYPVYGGHVNTPNGPQRGPLIGRATVTAEDDAGLHGLVELANTAAGNEYDELANMLGADLSIEADVLNPDDVAGGVARTATEFGGDLTGVAMILLPHHGAVPGAGVAATRSQPTGETKMPEPITPTPAATPPGDQSVETIGRAEVVDILRTEIARIRLPQLAEQQHPLAVFRTLGEFADASWSSPRVAGDPWERTELQIQVARAFADQITTNNPGVMAPGWLTEVFGIVDQTRHLVSAIGTRPLPAQGLEVDWPYFDGDLAALVAEQVTEKTQVLSVRVDLKKGQAPIKTYAGGSDISYQLIRRSTPSYRDAYLRIMSAAYALRTESAASIGLQAVSATAAAGWVLYNPATADPDLALFKGALFAASVVVEAATGQPADVVLASTAQFVRLGGLVVNDANPVQNTTGTGNAAGLTIRVSGLEVVHARYLTGDTIIVTNRQAVSWAEDGPMTISAPDIQKLGEDVAVWGMGALTATAPSGVVLLAPVDPVP